MSLPRDWVEVFVWTGHDKGYGRSSSWELRCLDCAVHFSPGGVWIDYIRPGLEDGSLIDAAQVCLRWIAERWTMAANGASVVDNRAGITFGVEFHGMLQRWWWMFRRLVLCRYVTFRMSSD